jgi:hypothetical protein
MLFKSQLMTLTITNYQPIWYPSPPCRSLASPWYNKKCAPHKPSPLITPPLLLSVQVPLLRCEGSGIPRWRSAVPQIPSLNSASTRGTRPQIIFLILGFTARMSLTPRSVDLHRCHNNTVKTPPRTPTPTPACLCWSSTSSSVKPCLLLVQSSYTS